MTTGDALLRCATRTSPMDCSDDSWSDTFFGKRKHGALWLLIRGASEKHLLTYSRSPVAPVVFGFNYEAKMSINSTILQLLRAHNATAYQIYRNRTTRGWIWLEVYFNTSVASAYQIFNTIGQCTAKLLMTERVSRFSGGLQADNSS